MNLKSNYILLCIDPSLKCTGWSIVKVSNEQPYNWNDKNLKLLDYGIIPTHDLDHGQALMYFENVITKIIHDYKPDYVSAESPFSGNNRDTIQKLCHIHGILQLICAKNSLNISYYAVMTAKSNTLPVLKLKKEDGTRKTGEDLKNEVSEEIIRIFGENSFIKEYNLDVTDSISMAMPFIKLDGESPKKTKPKKKPKKKQ